VGTWTAPRMADLLAFVFDLELLVGGMVTVVFFSSLLSGRCLL